MFEWLEKAEDKAKAFVKTFDESYKQANQMMNSSAFVNSLLKLRKGLEELKSYEMTKSEFGFEELKINKKRITFCNTKLAEINEALSAMSGRRDLDDALKQVLLKIKEKTELEKLSGNESELQALKDFNHYQTKILNADIECGDYKLSSALVDDEVAKAVNKGLDRYEDNAFESLRKVAKYKQAKAKAMGFHDEAVLSMSAHTNNLNLDVVKSLQSAVLSAQKEAKPLMDYLHSNVEGHLLKTQRLRMIKMDNTLEINYSLDEALKMISDSFLEVNEDMSEFVSEMYSNGFIDYEQRENKRSGACAKCYQEIFGHSVVVMTFDGSLSSVLTLAHELGHAYHHMILSRLDAGYRDYPLVFAETASMFAETLVLGYLLEKHKGTPVEKLFRQQRLIKYYDLMVMVPSRFDLEERIYVLEESNRLDADNFQIALIDNQKEWYPMHEHFKDNYNAWMLVRHYFMPESNFYNYPYYFGFLLNKSLMKEKKVRNFDKKFESFLRATGDVDAKEAWRNLFCSNMKTTNFWSSIVKELTETMKQDLKYVSKINTST